MSKLDRFPWLESMSEPAPQANPEPPPSPIQLVWEKARPLVPWLAFVAALSILGWLRTDERAPPPPPQVEVVAPLMPLAPRTALRPDQLQIFAVRRSSLTKTQLNDLVRPEQVSKLGPHIRTKRLVSPDRPLRWADLEWTVVNPKTRATAPIVYGTHSKETP